jgi:methylene-tetrahydromethanopterin dehydrogenase
MDRPYILHMLTPGPWMSPFDVNMAADAGYQVIVPYCGVDVAATANLTQDAIFSRGPKGVSRTGLFIGGRDVNQAVDMLDAARKAMVPPFVVSVMADPSGAFTTAAAMLACVRQQLRKAHGTDLAGRRVLVLGGTGPVGRVVAVLAARAGAQVRIASHKGQTVADETAQAVSQRFGSDLQGASSADAAGLRQALADTDVVLATAAAGVQVLSEEDLAAAGQKLLVAADVNAVPPAGIAGVGVMDDGKPVPGTQAVGIGALAVGNVKYQVQHQLLQRMRNAEKPLTLSFDDAFALACELRAG